jgi:hypothetical protein
VLDLVPFRLGQPDVKAVLLWFLGGAHKDKVCSVDKHYRCGLGLFEKEMLKKPVIGRLFPIIAHGIITSHGKGAFGATVGKDKDES